MSWVDPSRPVLRPKRIVCLIFHTLAIGSGCENTVETRVPMTRTWVGTLGRLLTMPLLDVAFSPDGMILASASWDGTVRLWEIASGKEIHKLSGHAKAVPCVVFTRGGKQLISGSADNSIRLWDVATGKLIQAVKGHEGGVYALAITSDGDLLVSAGNDKTIKLWRLNKR